MIFFGKHGEIDTYVVHYTIQNSLQTVLLLKMVYPYSHDIWCLVASGSGSVPTAQSPLLNVMTHGHSDSDTDPLNQ